MVSARIGLQLAFIVVSLQQLTGCGASVHPEVLALRTRLTLASSPAGGMTIEEARTKLAADEHDQEVVLTVRAGNKNYSAWCFDKDAVMVASEATPGSDYNVGPDHDASTCPFCKWKWKDEDSLVFLKIVDEAGSDVAWRCNQILDLSVGDTLSVTGTGSLDDGGFLHVQLTGVFLHN